MVADREEDHEAVASSDEDARVSDVVSGVFGDLSDLTRAELERRVSELRLPPGAVVFDVGENGDALFLVRSGLVDVVAGGADATRIVTLGPGEIFGEQALLTGRQRTATARAQTGVTLWRLDHADFLYLLGIDPELGAAVARVLSERLGATTRVGLGGARGQTVVVHALTAAAVSLLAHDLVAACTRMLGAPPVVLRGGPAEVWDGTLDPPGLLVADPEDLAGAAVRAVRDAGLVLLLCVRDVPESLAKGADWGVSVDDGRPDVLTGRSGSTAVMREGYEATELATLARTLCGRRIGLALGSGGIRGWAHAGILRAIVDNEIPIDFVSGASAGALAGALYCAGMDPTDMLAIPTIARDVLFACFRSYRPPTRSILSGRPFVTYLRGRLGRDARIEDLPKPMVIATTDLDTRQVVHLRSGPLPEAIVASAAVNGIFPPITIDGRRLVDGGATDPIPVAPLRALGADLVIAVNVMAIGRGASGVYTPRWRIPWPGMVDNLMIGLDTVITQASTQSCRLADVVVEPCGAEARWHEILPAAKYAAAGFKAMEAAVPQVRAFLGMEPSAPASENWLPRPDAPFTIRTAVPAVPGNSPAREK
jgi:NTE family protein